MHGCLVPEFFKIFKTSYTRKAFTGDLMAGIIVGIVALPLAIAFAIASGVKPEQGIYTAVVAGILLILMGVTRLGGAIRFIPYPMTVGFTSAIETGVVLAAVLFMNRMANATVIRRATPEIENDPHALADRSVPEDVEIFEIQGPFFFGAANKFKDTLQIVSKKPKVLIIRCRYILFIDATALRALEELLKKTKRDGTRLILSGVHAQPLITLEQSGLYYDIGEENIYGNIDDALNGARRVLGLPDVSRPVPFVPTVSRERAGD